MITPRPNINTRNPRNVTDSNGSFIGPGPFLARVVNHLDRKFGGALEVELIKFSSVSNTYEAEPQLRTVRYASPFYGTTPLRNNESNDTYANTQQSYGFWAVPPDVGSKVLVIFVEGRDDQGFWIACVQDDYVNFMIPDPRASTSLTTTATPAGLAGKKLPVGEYNKFLANPNNNYPTSQPRPYNPDYTERLLEQGLIDDDIRGVTSTSSRREAPSNVYGMSTPGPLDKRDGAPRYPRGPQGNQASVPSSRLGGHSIVMDDGDETILRRGSASSTPSEYVISTDPAFSSGDKTLPANEMFRIRTRTGHQILLHNTEDLIYISNSRGTAWIELTSNGKIDIFSQDSVSIHSSGDLNFTADRDVNFHAGENINLVSGKQFNVSAGQNMNVISRDKFSIESVGGFSVKSGNYIAFQSENGASLTSTNSDVVFSTSGQILLNAGSDIGLKSKTSIRANTDGDVHLMSNGDTCLHAKSGNLNLKSGEKVKVESGDTFNLKSTGNILAQVTSGSIHLKASSAAFIDAASGSVNIRAGESIFNSAASGGFNIQSSGNIAFDSDSNILLNSQGSSPATEADPAEGARPAAEVPESNPVLPFPPTQADIAARVPQHEPWLQHENLNPAAYTLDRTRAGMQQLDSFIPRMPDVYLAGTIQQTTTSTSTSDYRPAVAPGVLGDDEFTPNLTPVNDRVKAAFEYFVNKGMTAAQTAGIIGNLQVEVYPELDITTIGDNDNAFGLAQWNRQHSPDRFENFQAVIGIPLTQSVTLGDVGFRQQLDFIWWEMTGEPVSPVPVPPGLTWATGRPWSRNVRAYEAITALANPPDMNIEILKNIARRSAEIFDLDYEISSGAKREERKNNAVNILLLSLNNFDTSLPSPIANPNLTTTGGDPYAVDASATIPSGPALINDPGTGRLPNRVIQAQGSGTRNLPLQPELVNMLNRAAHAVGVTEVTVSSGGQPSQQQNLQNGLPPDGPVAAPNRLGSTRHDHGWAADFSLKYNGRDLDGDNLSDRQIMAAFITAAVSFGIRGVGWDSELNAASRGVPFRNNSGTKRGYMKSKHIHMDPWGSTSQSGGGSLSVWGSFASGLTITKEDGTSYTCFAPWVKEAAQRGLSGGLTA